MAERQELAVAQPDLPSDRRFPISRRMMGLRADMTPQVAHTQHRRAWRAGRARAACTRRGGRGQQAGGRHRAARCAPPVSSSAKPAPSSIGRRRTSRPTLRVCVGRMTVQRHLERAQARQARRLEDRAQGCTCALVSETGESNALPLRPRRWRCRATAPYLARTPPRWQLFRDGRFVGTGRLHRNLAPRRRT